MGAPQDNDLEKYADEAAEILAVDETVSSTAEPEPAQEEEQANG